MNGSAYTSVARGLRSRLTTIKFSDRPARYVKITQTGTSSSWWSIHELSISPIELTRSLLCAARHYSAEGAAIAVLALPPSRPRSASSAEDGEQPTDGRDERCLLPSELGWRMRR